MRSIAYMLSVGFLCLNAAAVEPEVLILAPDVAGLVAEGADGHTAAGSGIDILKWIVGKAGLSARYETVPLPRMQLLAKEWPNTCAVGVKFSAENANTYKWVGQITRSRMVLYSSKRHPVSVRALSECKRYVVGALRASSAAALLQANGIQAELASSQQSNYKKLLANRIQLWAATDLTVKRLPGLDRDELVESLVLGENSTEIACNRDMDDAVVSRLADALAKAKATGVLRLGSF